MSVQTISALVSLIFILALAAVFMRVWQFSGEPREYDTVSRKAYRFRAIWFGALVLIGMPVSIWLLREMPYNPVDGDRQVVNVTAYQWYWELDQEVLTAGTPVEFRVSSADVNHGFGIYDAKGQLLTQVQAMPGYVNKLVHTFDEPGQYEILCLEYCGVPHHVMTLDIEVAAAGEDVAPADEGGR